MDSWIRESPTHLLNTGKFNSLTDLCSQGAAADALNVVELSHKEPQRGAPTLSRRAALKSRLAATQKPYEAPAASSERLDELSSKIDAKYKTLAEDGELKAAILRSGASESRLPAKSFLLSVANENVGSFPNTMTKTVKSLTQYAVPLTPPPPNSTSTTTSTYQQKKTVDVATTTKKLENIDKITSLNQLKGLPTDPPSKPCKNCPESLHWTWQCPLQSSEAQLQETSFSQGQRQNYKYDL